MPLNIRKKVDKVEKKYFILIVLIIFISKASYAIDSKLIITCDQNINDKWYNTISENVPTFKTVDRVVKKQYFTILLFLSKYKINANKIADIKFDLIIKKPDGGNYFIQEGLEAINKKIDYPNYVQLSKTNLKVCFEPEDNLGLYQVVVNVYDLNSNKKSTNQYSIILSDFKKEEFFKSDESLNNWFHNYYSKPSPEKAIDAYLYYSKSKLVENKNGFIPMFSFFRELFNNDEYLIPHLTSLYSTQNRMTRIYIIYLLRYLNYDSRKFLNSLQGNEKKVYQKILTENFPSPQDKIKNASSLDLQWGVFFASGNIEPVRKLISALEYSKYNGSIDNFKNTSKTELDKQNALKDSIFQASRWSLEANAKQYPLVGNYCAYLFNNGDLTKNEKLWTGMILSKVYPDKFQAEKDETGSWVIQKYD